MNFTVINNWRTQPYVQMSVESDNAKLDSGLLDETEAIELARQLINAAYDLIYKHEDEIAQKLVNILNEDL